MFNASVFQCHNRHNTLLHIDIHTQPNDKGSTNHNRSVDAKGNPTAEVNTYVHSRANPETTFYLQQLLWKFRINLANMSHVEHC